MPVNAPRNAAMFAIVFLLASFKSATAADNFPESKHIPPDTVALATATPAKLLEYKPLKDLLELEMLFEFKRTISPFTLDDLAQVERAYIAIDQPLVNKFAASQGLNVPNTPKVNQPVDMAMNLMQVGLAMHNYHDVYSHLPRANGDGEGESTGLSWRVHLLPFLEESALYDEFHLDEPWDSPHNKKLIPKMPKLFVVDGVEAPGKTSLQVISGSNSLFPEDAKKGTRFRDVVDGLSYSIMVINAAPETAVEWTKPGGIKFDPKKPLACLGKRPADGNWMLLGDGSANKLSAEITDAAFADCVTINDGNVVNSTWFKPERLATFTAPTPTIILTFKSPFDIKKFTADSRKMEAGAYTVYDMDGFGLCPTTTTSPTTLVIGETQVLLDRIKAGKFTSSKPDPLLSQLDSTADVSAVINLKPQRLLLKQVAEQSPEMTPLLDYQMISQHIWATDRKPGDPIMKAKATFATARIAMEQLKALTTITEQIKVLATSSLPVALPEPIRANATELSTIKLERSSDTISATITTPARISELVAHFPPMVEYAATAKVKKEQFNNLKQMALAFHNFHDTYNHLPSTTSGVNKAQKGLSWRVHLLPFLQEIRLYEQFHFDEPWDSEHNLKLAEYMPPYFKTPGVTESNKTSMHVLTGEGAPFAKENSPRFADITDGLSNTILVIYAAPEKAEIWTKPGGLEIDMEKPVRSLGDFNGQATYYSLFDGSVQTLPPNYRAAAMRNLIRHQDGE